MTDSAAQRNGALSELVMGVESCLMLLRCAICLTTMDSPKATTPCEHLFCASCIQTALSNHPVCPLCKHDVSARRGHRQDTDVEAIIASFKRIRRSAIYNEALTILKLESISNTQQAIDLPVSVSIPALPKERLPTAAKESCNGTSVYPHVSRDLQDMKCVICGSNQSLAFKPMDSGHFVHLFCALWIPELFITDTKSMSPVSGFRRVPVERFNMTCCICNQRKVGYCIQCAYKRCAISVHPICALQSGAHLEYNADDNSAVKQVTYLFYCNKHAEALHSEK